MDQPPKTATIGATKDSLLNDNDAISICDSLLSLIERAATPWTWPTPPASASGDEGHIMHEQCSQYAALPAIAFGG